MDFASALANLQKTAQQAASNNNNNNNNRLLQPPLDQQQPPPPANYHQQQQQQDRRRGRSNSFGGGGGGQPHDLNQRRNQRPRHDYGPPTMSGRNTNAAIGNHHRTNVTTTTVGRDSFGAGGRFVGDHSSPTSDPHIYHQHQQQQQRSYPANRSTSSTQSYSPHLYPNKRRQYKPRNLLQDLEQYGYRVAPYEPTCRPDWKAAGMLAHKKEMDSQDNLANSVASVPSTRPRHIALLAITIDDLPHEAIWRAWCDQGNATTSNGQPRVLVSVLCHAKFPDRVRSPWLQQRLLVKPPRLGRGNSFADPVWHSHRPEWGSIQITRAMIDLISTGLEVGTVPVNDPKEMDPRFSTRRFLATTINSKSNKEPSFLDISISIPPVDKFIFISETCIPIRSLSECIYELFDLPPPERAFGTTVAPASTTTVAQHETKGDGSTMPIAKEEKSSVTGLASVNSPTSLKRTSADVVMSWSWQVSWVNARNRKMPGTPQNMYEKDQFAEISRMVPGQYRWKADQWMVLSRPHAVAMAAVDQHMPYSRGLWNSFTKINASDEMYFPTALGILQILTDEWAAATGGMEDKDNDSSNNSNNNATLFTAVMKTTASAESSGAASQASTALSGDSKISHTASAAAATTTITKTTTIPCGVGIASAVLRRPVTYTDWTEGMRNPATFTRGIADLRRVVIKARQQGCLFARKFAPPPPSSTQKGLGKEQTSNQSNSNENKSGILTVDEWETILADVRSQESAQAATTTTAVNDNDNVGAAKPA